jgi:hypothetical protein
MALACTGMFPADFCERMCTQRAHAHSLVRRHALVMLSMGTMRSMRPMRGDLFYAFACACPQQHVLECNLEVPECIFTCNVAFYVD